MQALRMIRFSFLAVAILFGGYVTAQHNDHLDVRLELLEVTQQPILGRDSPGAEEILWGFEGGFVTEENGLIHIFSTENYDNPKWVSTRFGHWTSEDGLHFERQSTIFHPDSNALPAGVFTDMPWTPYPIYNEEEGRYNLFFVGYKSQVSHENTNILRAASQTPGHAGIGGPYEVLDVAMNHEGADPWEVKSALFFFPYRVGEEWRAFFGENNYESRATARFRAGLVRSKSLSGPWERMSHLNPVLMDDRFIENPVVFEVEPGVYVTFYDGETVSGIAYAYSADGEHWTKERNLWLDHPPTAWAWYMRTPLGIVKREGGGYWLYYTALDYEGFDPTDPNERPWYHRGFGTIGRIGVDIVITREGDTEAEDGE